jgi:hypothetical protein
VKLGELNHDIPFVLHTGDDRDDTKAQAEMMGGIYRFKGDVNPTLTDFFAALLKTPRE